MEAYMERIQTVWDDGSKSNFIYVYVDNKHHSILYSALESFSYEADVNI